MFANITITACICHSIKLAVEYDTCSGGTVVFLWPAVIALEGEKQRIGLARAFLRGSDKCPFMETKTFCSNCKVHCYRKDMREKIRIMITVTVVMGSGFAVMFLKEICIPCYILAGVWVMHLLIFSFVIKTYVSEDNDHSA